LVKIRLRRTGAKKSPSYRLVVADSRAPRDGAFIAIIGHYNPLTEPETIVIDEEKALGWLKQGAQPTDTAARLLAKAGIIEEPEARKEKIKAGAPAKPKAKKKAKAEVAKEPEAKATEEPKAEVAKEPEAKATEEPKAEVTEEPEAKATEEPKAEVTEEPEASATEEPQTGEEQTETTKEKT